MYSKLNTTTEHRNSISKMLTDGKCLRFISIYIHVYTCVDIDSREGY